MYMMVRREGFTTAMQEPGLPRPYALGGDLFRLTFFGGIRHVKGTTKKTPDGPGYALVAEQQMIGRGGNRTPALRPPRCQRR
ncbi:hypothetical protein NKJ26_01955 [Mesorhizobium sp. M0152]|uniref:hypothetical protein n=1 Tax=Mesorhizobium sp. M0152 TaxID=2956898 RepID=UPI003338486E